MYTFDVSTAQMVSTMPLATRVLGVALAEGQAWVNNATSVFRFDTTTGAASLWRDLGRTDLTGMTHWPTACPLPVEVCNGVDDDFDGLVDEGLPDSDGDSICDALDVEVCDGLDNDGDGALDEGFDLDNNGIVDCVEEPCNCVDDDRDGLVDELCRYDLGLVSAGTGQWQTWLDGSLWGTGSTATGTLASSAVVAGGLHHLAVKVDVDGGRYPGFLADVYLQGRATVPTGQGNWSVSPSAPAGGWQTVVQPQTEQLTGVPYPPQAGFLWSNAAWVWSDQPDPLLFSGNWYVLPLQVCGPVDWLGQGEVCNGVDDDGDGAADEGFPDLDQDGVPECMETEPCNGVDDDGDRFIDEGWPDLDGDGIPDCL
jgi:hypothetical protein